MTKEDFLNIKISYQKNTFSDFCETITISDALNKIKDRDNENNFNKIRDYLNFNNEKKYKEEKGKLPVFAFCANFDTKIKNENINNYNKILIIDIDNLIEEVDKNHVENALIKCNYIITYFKSPSNRGYKALVAINYQNSFDKDENVKNHRCAFQNFMIFFKETYNIIIDKSGSNISRLCYLSYDPTIIIKENFEKFKVDNSTTNNINKIIEEHNIIELNNKDTLIYKNKNKNKKAVESIISYLQKNNKSITYSYNEWWNIALAISKDFSFDIGKDYYDALSKQDIHKYNCDTCLKKLNDAYNIKLIDNNFSINTIIKYAVQKGFKTSKNLLEMGNQEAKKFFLKEESYYNGNLPPYFKFTDILNVCEKELDGKKISDFYSAKRTNRLKYIENINYKFTTNKDGKYAFRPFQLINPILYVNLINLLTTQENWKIIIERFNKFQCDEIKKKIKCLSIPLESIFEIDRAKQINEWWESIEQESIKLSLEFDYIIHTDITDCYGSFYTHSIEWAIVDKEIAKQHQLNNNNNNNNLGKLIDDRIKEMQYNQTNGIPQGSILMDFIAEIILGYIDYELYYKIKDLGKFLILRYRDDYRIFTNNPQNGEEVLKYLTEILFDFGLKLNSSKTKISNNVIKSSIKEDKFGLINHSYFLNEEFNLKKFGYQKFILFIYDYSEKYTNAGVLKKLFYKLHKSLKNEEYIYNSEVLISILTEIMFKNPRHYEEIILNISVLLSKTECSQKKEIISKIRYKLQKLPNIGYLEIWLQRLTIKFDIHIDYKENICRYINNKKIESLWNLDWLKEESDLYKKVKGTKIIDEKLLENISEIINETEVNIFGDKSL